MRLLPIFLLASLVALLVADRAVAGDVCTDAQNSCTTVNLKAPGCSEPVCCATVCALEPICCDVAWDELCVALAIKFCPSCGVSLNSCFEDAATPGCVSSSCCNYICSQPGYELCCNLAWDANCVLAAEMFCQGCGAPGAEICHVVHEGVGCSDFECCSAVCVIDPACCLITWDATCVQWAEQLCPGCGSPLIGSCCWPHAGPFCDDAECCQAVCEVDNFCCTNTWDFNCVTLAQAVCTELNCLCGDPTAGLCKTVHATPYCDDFDCCTAVCFLDSFCCAVSWDLACTQVVEALCGQDPACGDLGSGSCHIKHATPGCDDGGCCQKVCNIDMLCCQIEWDQDCVAFADLVCTECGNVLTGSCYVPHGSPSCSDKPCCDTICAGDPFCCQEEWDSVCAFLAVAVCPPPVEHCGMPSTRSCYVASFLPGCDDAVCCIEICTTIDPFCCEAYWDAACVDIALTFCGSVTGCPGRGSCITEHTFPGCNDALCCSAVCELDDTCCSLGWDATCVTMAKSVCFGLQVCPGKKRCDQAHGSPGCDDPSCCNVVCSIDPICCLEKWDIFCVESAQTRCQPAPDSNCPCLGSCVETHINPGCNDASCCAGVCLLDVSCCELTWDQLCVNLARGICCGNVGCGNSCAGTCFEPHDHPYCSSPSCCEAVCAFDSFCCDSKWDGVCVDLAEERCQHICGVPGSGSCFVAKATPSCNDRACCDLVCNVDPICCETVWDGACVVLAKGDPDVRPPKLALCTEPKCGDFIAGQCCVAHDNPACDDLACCTSVCLTDPFCCDTTWDDTCAGEAHTKPECNCVSECGDACAGDCCTPHLTPLCNDVDCCSAVCLVDPFCCDLGGGAWDDICLAIVFTTPDCETPCPLPECGDADAGDCCTAHFFPNCSDESCCKLVCSQDSFCCDVQWDITCASEAGDLCPECKATIFCGSAKTESCFFEHAEPFCDNFACCSFVCTLDPTCCETAWDQTCVDLAVEFCGG